MEGQLLSWVHVSPLGAKLKLASCTHLVHVEDEVEFANVLKALVQRLDEHLRKEGTNVKNSINIRVTEAKFYYDHEL
jgi:hypothetical protein